MRNLTKLAVLASALVSCGAFAQSSSTITGSGTITPVACTLGITTGGVSTNYEWGTDTQTAWLARLDATTVASGPDYKYVGNLNHVLNVTCPSATKVALQFVDNHATSTPPAGANITSAGSPWTPTPFGLADVNNANAHEGLFIMYNNSITVNGGAVPGTKLRAANGTTSWAALVNGNQGTTHSAHITPGYTYAFTPGTGATAPVAITSIGGSIGSDTFLNRPYVAGVTTSSKFESSVTVSLRYF